MTTLLLRILFDDGLRLGPGKVALLEAIDASGSISAAARQMGMSYRRAWLLLEELHEMFSTPVAETTQGGMRGGGATLTAFGHEVIARYRSMESALRQATRDDLAFLEGHLRHGAT